MNRRHAAEIAAYAAAVRFYRANAIMCHLMPGDRFRFPHSDVEYIAGKSCWYRRHAEPHAAVKNFRTGRLTAVILIKHSEGITNS